MASSHQTIGQARFRRVAGAAQEGGSVVVKCAKTNKNGGECRSLSRSNTSAARDLRPREGDLNLIDDGLVTPNHGPSGRSAALVVVVNFLMRGCVFARDVRFARTRLGARKPRVAARGAHATR